MRVLHLTDRLTNRGGAHQHLLGVIEALREQGHEVFPAAGADEGRVDPGCPVRIVAGSTRARGRRRRSTAWRRSWPPISSTSTRS